MSEPSGATRSAGGGRYLPASLFPAAAAEWSSPDSLPRRFAMYTPAMMATTAATGSKTLRATTVPVLPPPPPPPPELDDPAPAAAAVPGEADAPTTRGTGEREWEGDTPTTPGDAVPCAGECDSDGGLECDLVAVVDGVLDAAMEEEREREDVREMDRERERVADMEMPACFWITNVSCTVPVASMNVPVNVFPLTSRVK